MKKIAVLFALIICVLMLPFLSWFNRDKYIGAVSGAEWEYLNIEDRKYERMADTPFSGADKGEFLGTATDGEERFDLYRIKETEAYLYCRWEWEGWIYQLVQ